jgi:predicted nuclease of predicted toxin-antitoxin system
MTLRIRADEHIPKSMVDIVRDVIPPGDVELSDVRTAGHSGSSDVAWVTQFANEGGHAILTADTDFFKKYAQIKAIHHSGLKVVHLPAQWANQVKTLQIALVFLWWDRIIRKIGECRKGECWGVPWKWSLEGGLVLKDMNRQEAEKKVKRELKRRR